MKVLVIGGTKFIGPPTVGRLILAGHQVALYNRGVTSDSVPARVAYYQGDRLDVPILKEALNDFSPDVVLDMCSFFEQHQDAFERASHGKAIKHVLVSSCDVYRHYGGLIGKEEGPPDDVPMREDAPLRSQLYPYRGVDWAREGFEDYDKIPIEKRVLERGGAVVRLPMVYGPGDRQHRLYPHLSRMVAARPFVLLGTQEAKWKTCRAHVENVAHALCLAVERGGAGEVYNIAEQPALTEREWVEAIGVSFGWNGSVGLVPDESLPSRTVERPQWHLAIDSTKIRKELGFSEVIGFAEGLASTIEWESANPPDGFEQPDYAKEDEVWATRSAL